jgi:hypothetical protein
MQILRTVLLSGALLLGIAGAGIHSTRASAQAVSDGSAGVACVQSSPNWTDCTLTLSHAIQAGGSIAGTLPAGDGTVAYCERPGEPYGDGTSEVPVCGINGNAAVFLCPSGCGAGTQFVMSALGAPAASAASVAQELRVVSSGTVAQDSQPHGNQPALLGPSQGA